MKRLLLLCCVVLVMGLLFAGEQGDAEKLAGVSGVEMPLATPVGQEFVEPVFTEADVITRMDVKAQYYELVNRLNLGLADARDITVIRELCFSFDLPLPDALLPEEDPGRNPLDQGSTDTLANCASATVITGCGYTDSGNLDGDNDCSVISASPYNEVFYTFTPAVSGPYTFQLTTASTLASPAAIRVVRGGCCSGALAVAFSSATTTDVLCNVPIKTVYVSPILTAGTQYWIHCGTSTSTAGDVSAYTLSVICTPCPTDEPAVAHNTCATAVPGPACGDSLSGDSADQHELRLVQPPGYVP